MSYHTEINALAVKFAARSQTDFKSGIVFGAIAAMLQIGIIAGLGLPSGKTVAGFAFVSLIAVGIPFAAAIFYWRRAVLTAARPNRKLYRALHGEPNLIEKIIVETPPSQTAAQIGTDIVGERRQHLIGKILDGIFDANTTPDVSINLTSGGKLLPSVSITLTDGKTHCCETSENAFNLVAALKQYSPRAVVSDGFATPSN